MVELQNTFAGCYIKELLAALNTKQFAGGNISRTTHYNLRRQPCSKKLVGCINFQSPHALFHRLFCIVFSNAIIVSTLAIHLETVRKRDPGVHVVWKLDKMQVHSERQFGVDYVGGLPIQPR